MTPTIEDVQQDFKELNVYFNDLSSWRKSGKRFWTFMD